MGKGKGNIKNWFIKINTGRVLFYLIRWVSEVALYALKILKIYLPGKNVAILPFLKKFKYYFYKNTFLI
jgi:ribosomal protein L16/L10AE